MKAIGIVVEYNPFHNGHKYHLEMARKNRPQDVIIAVMSGDFVQRGEPSIVDKWTKTKMALASGVDMVVELPVFYSSQNAEIFSKGAVGILNELRCSSLVFGSESGDLDELLKISSYQESKIFKENLKARLKEGFSYPTAHSMTMKDILNEKTLDSNDILALEYLKAIKYWDSNITPLAIKREKVGYFDLQTQDNFASATKIREVIKSQKIAEIKNFVPKKCFDILKDYKNFTYIEDFYPIFRYEVLKNIENMKNIQDIEEGFENRLLESAKKYTDYSDFFASVTSKRYTTSRIQRSFIHSILGLEKDFSKKIKKEIPYVRVLGFNKKGREYLSYLKKFENKKIITTYKKMNEIFSPETCKIIEFNEKCSEIYRLINRYTQYKSPIIFEEEKSGK